MILLENLQSGVIKNITDKMGNLKHESIIGEAISYNPNYIKEGSRAILYFTEYNDRFCRTSNVVKIHEDSLSLTIYTENSVFYIEKDVDKE